MRKADVVPDVGAPSFEVATDDINFASPIDVSELFAFPTQQTFDQADLDITTGTGISSASITAHVPAGTFGYCDFENLNKEIVEGTGELFSFSKPIQNLNDLSESLEPITMEYVHSEEYISIRSLKQYTGSLESLCLLVVKQFTGTSGNEQIGGFIGKNQVSGDIRKSFAITKYDY